MKLNDIGRNKRPKSQPGYCGLSFPFNIVAIDEPGGNRNRSINIKAQHKTRRAAITQIYFKQHLLQKS